MTKREAIRECKELWKEIEESGKTKYGFLGSPSGKKWRDKDYRSSCPLCEYSGSNCTKCPLITQYGKMCAQLGFKTYGHTPGLPEFYEAVRGLK